MDRRKISTIIIHCSASPNGRATPIDDIDAWHRERGFERKQIWRSYLNPGLSSVGYHWVIDTDGTVYTGRHPDEVGAHAAGHNSHTIGVCVIGTDKFTLKQWQTLSSLIPKVSQAASYPEIIGHRDLPDVHKSCPGFSVRDWIAGDMAALAGHILCEDGVRDE